MRALGTLLVLAGGLLLLLAPLDQGEAGSHVSSGAYAPGAVGCHPGEIVRAQPMALPSYGHASYAPATWGTASYSSPIIIWPCYCPCYPFYPGFGPSGGGSGGGGGGPAQVPDSSYKVKYIFVLDTEDPQIKKSVRTEGKAFELLLFEMERQYRGQFDYVQGKDLTGERVLQAIKDMPVGKNETLLVYCNLHGEARGVTQAQNLLMKEGEKKLDRQAIMDAILAKDPKPRLSVLITDACFQANEADEEDEIKSKFRRDEKPAARIDPDRVNFILKTLLVEQKGVVNINSCSPPLPARGAPKGERAWEGIFTPALIGLCTGQNQDKSVTVSDTAELNWKAFFAALKKETNFRYRDLVTKLKENKRPIRKAMEEQTGQNPYWFGDEDKDVRREEEKEAAPVRVPTPASMPKDEDDEPAKLPAPPKGGDEKSPSRDDDEVSAVVKVKVPAGASLTIDGEPTQQTAKVRLFETPRLRRGKNYVYTFRAEVARRSGKVAESKKVTVTGGAQVEVDFGDMKAAARPVARAAAARIKVRVPATSEVLLNSAPTRGSGTVRELTTPLLQPDKQYFYTVEMKHRVQGKTVSEKRRVQVEAGKTAEVDFMSVSRKSPR